MNSDKPQLITNKGLVDLFLKALSVDVCRILRMHLALGIKKSAPDPGTTERCVENPFLIDDVIKTLKEVAEGERGSVAASSRTFSEPVTRVKTEIVETDLFKHMEGYMQKAQKNWEETMKTEMRSMMAQLTPRNDQLPRQPAPHVHKKNDSCFFCWEQGHMQPNCKWFLEFLSKGWIIPGAGGRGYQLPGGEVLPKEHYTSTAPRFRIETWWAQKNRRGQNIQHQLLIEDWEAEKEGLIAMGPPPSEWYGHPTMDIYQQEMENHGLGNNLLAGMHNEIASLRRKLESVEGQKRAETATVNQVNVPPAVIPTQSQSVSSGNFTKEEVIAMINAVTQSQNAITRSGHQTQEENGREGF